MTTIIDENKYKNCEDIYVLMDYNFIKGKLISKGPKNYKIFVQYPFCLPEFKSFKPEKTAKPDEVICILCDTSRAPRGKYTIIRNNEMEQIPQHVRYQARFVARQNGNGRIMYDGNQYVTCIDHKQYIW